MTTDSNYHTANNDRSVRIITIVFFLLAGIIGAGLLAGSYLFLQTGTNAAVPLGALLGLSSKTPWHLSRSAGIVAYLLLLGSTVWGILLSSKLIKESVPAALSLAMHNILSWLALAFTGFHALILLLDSYYTYTLADLTIPFIGPYRPAWVGLGIIGFYLMAVINLSFQFRKQIGQKKWRALHYLSFALFILATVHGIGAGTDTGKAGMQFLYLGSGLLVFLLTNYRILTARAKQSNHQRVHG